MLTLIVGFIVKLPVITVSCENKVLYEELLGEEVEITLEYVHSVEKTTVIEVFKARSSGIYLEKFLWQSFGSGLPSESTDIIKVKGFYCMEGMEKKIGLELIAWFIPENMCKIQINGKHIAMLSNGGLLAIRLTYKPVIEIAVKRLLGGWFGK